MGFEKDRVTAMGHRFQKTREKRSVRRFTGKERSAVNPFQNRVRAMTERKGQSKGEGLACNEDATRQTIYGITGP